MIGFVNILLAGTLAIVPTLAIENTNIAGYDELRHCSDYNRLRADITLEHEKYTDVLGKLIIDNETIYTSKPNHLQNDPSIYRAYLQYRGSKHLWSIGKQRIPLGVGRIWNPLDVFNPIDFSAVETSERIGTESIRYEYAVSYLSNIDMTVAKDKGAIRLKGYFDFADVGLVGIWDRETDEDIVGWEIEGQLMETGIELRSEGGRFYNRNSGEQHTEFIIGAEYGFENSLNLLGEYKYSDETKNSDIGALVTYQPATLWFCSLLMVANIDDHSTLIAPSVEYSLSDEMTLSAGSFFYRGSNDDEFGQASDRYYMRWFIHF